MAKDIAGSIEIGSGLSSTLADGKEPMTRFLSDRQADSAPGRTPDAGYEKTRRDVTALLSIDEDDEYTRPSSYALNFVLDLLEDANVRLLSHGKVFPRGNASASESGGIYLFWKKDAVSVQVEVPGQSGGLAYTHVLTSHQSVMNREVSANLLAQTLTNFILSDH